MKKILAIIIAAILAFGFSGCEKEPPSVYLFGESHGAEIITLKEYELWHDYYHNEGMRHLFIEDSYAGAQFLNIWMQSEDNTILEQLRGDTKGSSAYADVHWDFYRLIKENCPETVFHGTDIGHQYDTTCTRYLEYLEENGMKDSEEYRLALENLEDGKYFYDTLDPNLADGYKAWDFREEKMAENFIREFDSLGGESVMGIYGSSHTPLDGMSNYNRNLPCMANMIHQNYGESVTMLSTFVEDLIDSPIIVETVSVNGKDYEASYYGSIYVANYTDDYEYFNFWRLENAYEDFKGYSKSSRNMTISTFPMPVKENEILVIDYISKTGETERTVHIITIRNGEPLAKELVIE
ncbi:MAG: hypothetical protein IJ306_00990 [Oscillospiraceae bacterium]|nr:hypothetical protein [Oscillospiraceae bacterium]